MLVWKEASNLSSALWRDTDEQSVFITQCRVDRRLIKATADRTQSPAAVTLPEAPLTSREQKHPVKPHVSECPPLKNISSLSYKCQLLKFVNSQGLKLINK